MHTSKSHFKNTNTLFYILTFFIILWFFTCSQLPKKLPSDPPEILGRVTFDHRHSGERYGNWDVKRDFGTVKSWGTYWPFRRLRIVHSDPQHNKVLQVRYPEKKVRFFSSGASWHWKPFMPRHEVFFSYWVQFPDSFVFRHGGKMHGLTGGKGNTGGNKPNGHDGWSCRLHWGPDDLIKLYIYHKDQQRKWGDTFYLTQNPEIIRIDISKPITRHHAREIRIERGKWHHIMIRVKVNAAGFRNGLAQAWYDGKLVMDIRGFEFRDETCQGDELLIEGVYFSTFFGGRGDEYKPVKDEFVLFDDFVVSKTLYCPPEITCDPLPD